MQKIVHYTMMHCTIPALQQSYAGRGQHKNTLSEVKKGCKVNKISDTSSVWALVLLATQK